MRFTDKKDQEMSAMVISPINETRKKLTHCSYGQNVSSKRKENTISVAGEYRVASSSRRQSLNMPREGTRQLRTPSPARDSQTARTRSRSPGMFISTTSESFKDKSNISLISSRRQSLDVRQHSPTRRPSSSRRGSMRLDCRSVSPLPRECTWEKQLRQPTSIKSSSARNLTSDSHDSSMDQNSYAEENKPRIISPAKICAMFGIDRGSLPTGSDAFRKALDEMENDSVLNQMETDFGDIKIKVTCD